MSSGEGAARTLRAVIADDDPFTLSLVTGGLKSQGFEVFAATTAAEAWRLIEAEEPHALVTDLNLGTGESGAALLRRVHEEFPWVGLVVLTSHQSPQLAVDDSAEMPENVVYLVKSMVKSVDDLATAVRRGIAGQAPPEVSAERGEATGAITSAQAEVLRMLAKGASTRTLAEHRGTTVRAVETMLARLYTALGIENDGKSNPRVEAVHLWQQGRIKVR